MVGLPVLAAEANGALSSPWRRALTLLAALAGVFLVLLAVRRSARAAAVPLIPIALATGWSGAILFVLGLLPGPLQVQLNPMSVTLGALVIAISTEFSVLLSARYSQERHNGAGPARAIELAYASTGAAVLASGATAIAGFAALAASDIRMLRDFGVVTVVDLTVSLRGRDDRPARGAPLGRGARALRPARPRPAAPAARAARAAHAGGRTVSDDRFERPRRRAARARRARASATPGRARPHASRAGAPAGGPATRQQVRLARGHPRRHGAERAPVHHDAARTAARACSGPEPGSRLKAFAAPSALGRPGGRRERLPAQEGLQQDATATRRPARCAAREW